MSAAQRRLLAAQEATLTPPPPAAEGSDDDASSDDAPLRSSAFAALAPSACEPATLGDAKKKKKKKKAAAKKKNSNKAQNASGKPVTKPSPAPADAPAQRKRAGDKRRNAKKLEEAAELDALLAQVNGPTPAAVPATAKGPGRAVDASAPRSTAKSLVGVVCKALDSEAELSRLFGSKPTPRRGPHTWITRRDAKWPDVRPLVHLVRLGVQGEALFFVFLV